jgi:hypothetical protein
MAGKNKYNEKDKEKAIAVMATNINPDTKKPNWRYCERALNISNKTLMKWWNEQDNDVKATLRDQKKEEFIEEAWNEVVGALKDLPIKRIDANYRDTIVGIATLIDKIQVIQEKPTVITKNQNENENHNTNTIDLESLSIEELDELEKIIDKATTNEE